MFEKRASRRDVREQFRERNKKRRAIENIGGEEDTIPHKRQRIVKNESIKVTGGVIRKQSSFVKGAKSETRDGMKKNGNEEEVNEVIPTPIESDPNLLNCMSGTHLVGKRKRETEPEIDLTNMRKENTIERELKNIPVIKSKRNVSPGISKMRKMFEKSEKLPIVEVEKRENEVKKICNTFEIMMSDTKKRGETPEPKKQRKKSTNKVVISKRDGIEKIQIRNNSYNRAKN